MLLACTRCYHRCGGPPLGYSITDYYFNDAVFYSSCLALCLVICSHFAYFSLICSSMLRFVSELQMIDFWNVATVGNLFCSQPSRLDYLN